VPHEKEVVGQPPRLVDGGVVAQARVGAARRLRVLGDGDPAEAGFVAVGALLNRGDAEVRPGGAEDVVVAPEEGRQAGVDGRGVVPGGGVPGVAVLVDGLVGGLREGDALVVQTKELARDPDFLKSADLFPP
jgi:hypothetical protein